MADNMEGSSCDSMSAPGRPAALDVASQPEEPDSPTAPTPSKPRLAPKIFASPRKAPRDIARAASRKENVKERLKAKLRKALGPYLATTYWQGEVAKQFTAQYMSENPPPEAEEDMPAYIAQHLRELNKVTDRWGGSVVRTFDDLAHGMAIDSGLQQLRDKEEGRLRPEESATLRGVEIPFAGEAPTPPHQPLAEDAEELTSSQISGALNLVSDINVWDEIIAAQKAEERRQYDIANLHLHHAARIIQRHWRSYIKRKKDEQARLDVLVSRDVQVLLNTAAYKAMRDARNKLELQRLRKNLSRRAAAKGFGSAAPRDLVPARAPRRTTETQDGRRQSRPEQPPSSEQELPPVIRASSIVQRSAQIMRRLVTFRDGFVPAADEAGGSGGTSSNGRAAPRNALAAELLSKKWREPDAGGIGSIAGADGGAAGADGREEGADGAVYEADDAAAGDEESTDTEAAAAPLGPAFDLSSAEAAEAEAEAVVEMAAELAEVLGDIGDGDEDCEGEEEEECEGDEEDYLDQGEGDVDWGAEGEREDQESAQLGGDRSPALEGPGEGGAAESSGSTGADGAALSGRRPQSASAGRQQGTDGPAQSTSSQPASPPAQLGLPPGSSASTSAFPSAAAASAAAAAAPRQGSLALDPPPLRGAAARGRHGASGATASANASPARQPRPPARPAAPGGAPRRRGAALTEEAALRQFVAGALTAAAAPVLGRDGAMAIARMALADDSDSAELSPVPPPSTAVARPGRPVPTELLQAGAPQSGPGSPARLPHLVGSGAADSSPAAMVQGLRGRVSNEGGPSWEPPPREQGRVSGAGAEPAYIDDPDGAPIFVEGEGLGDCRPPPRVSNGGGGAQPLAGVHMPVGAAAFTSGGAAAEGAPAPAIPRPHRLSVPGSCNLGPSPRASGDGGASSSVCAAASGASASPASAPLTAASPSSPMLPWASPRLRLPSHSGAADSPTQRRPSDAGSLLLPPIAASSPGRCATGPAGALVAAAAASDLVHRTASDPRMTRPSFAFPAPPPGQPHLQQHTPPGVPQHHTQPLHTRATQPQPGSPGLSSHGLSGLGPGYYGPSANGPMGQRYGIGSLAAAGRARRAGTGLVGAASIDGTLSGMPLGFGGGGGRVRRSSVDGPNALSGSLDSQTGMKGVFAVAGGGAGSGRHSLTVRRAAAPGEASIAPGAAPLSLCAAGTGSPGGASPLRAGRGSRRTSVPSGVVYAHVGPS